MIEENNFNFLFPDERDIPSEFRVNEPINQKEYLINGELARWDGPVKDVYSPIYIRKSNALKQKKLGSFPLMTTKESLEILDVAHRAFNEGKGEWPTFSVEERITHLKKFIFMMKEAKSEIVKLIMWEIGKSLEDSKKEFDRTVIYIEETISALKDLDRISSRFVIQEGVIAQIRRAPLGVALCMGPYNYPLNETFTTMIPALIMGNVVIFKPPRFGVLLYKPLLKAFKESFPAGVINTIYGEGSQIISPLMSSGKIDVLAFIGSSRVADILKHQHPKPHRLRCVLGLDAKNAAILLPDADLDNAVKESVLGTLSFNGQRCTAIKILFVHKDIINIFLDKFSQEVDSMKVGMPWDQDVKITPLADTSRVTFMQELIEDAKKHGGKVINENGNEIDRTIFTPAIVYPVNKNMRLYHEEQFGPIVPIASFDDVSEPIQYITESNYGQQVSIFGKNPELIGKLLDPLVNQVCRVNINSQCQRGPDTFPFTGRKDSAEGTLSVSDALRVFSIRTLVAAKEIDLNREILNTIVRNHQSKFLSTDFIL
ncbi:NADP-dependent glyceraldehyde-3-phosphate dehydrogenase [bacterium]|nr:NADP-dependent glyceraldehyde-3-phosphate dehydrogenase [bacterium]